MKRLLFYLTFIYIFVLGCETSSLSFRDDRDYIRKYYRSFSISLQQFRENLTTSLSPRFCYRVYFEKHKPNTPYAYEFINEKGDIEFIGYFNIAGKLKKILVADYSRGRMNMELYYSMENKLTKVVLMDDNRNIFAYGKVKYTNNKRVMHIEYRLKNENIIGLQQIIRTDRNGNELEIATYSSNGRLYTNHLYFYDRNNKLIKYYFYKKLEYIFGLSFNSNGQIKNELSDRHGYDILNESE